MAIIYTYPVKTTPNANDLILISDSQDSNKTKQVKISSLPGGSGSGVSSVTSANAAITVADPSTTPVLTSVAYSGGTGIGHVPTGSGGSATVYLDGSGNWSTPSGSGGDTYTLQAEAKSNNSVPLKLDAATGTDSTVNLTEGSGVTLTRNSATEITIAATGSGYTLPLATNSVRGGLKIGYTQNAKNYPVQLSSEQAYVNVPWTDNNTTYDVMGSGNSYAAGLVPAGNATHNNQFLRRDGSWQTVSASASPSGNNTEIQYNNNGSFGASANLTFATNTLAVTHTVDIKGDGTNAGKLKLYCQSTSVPHAVTIEGPDHANAAAYTLKLPSPAPTTNQLLEYENSTNNLRWINTPTAGVSPTSGTWYATLANASGQSYASNATQAQISITTNNCQWYRVGDMMYYQFYIAGTVKAGGTLTGNLFLCRSSDIGGTASTYGLPTVSANTPTIVNDGFCNGSVTITESEAPAQPLTWTFPVNGGRVGRDTNYPGYVQLFSLLGSGSTNKVYYPLSNQTWVTAGEVPGNFALGGTINALVIHQ